MPLFLIVFLILQKKKKKSKYAKSPDSIRIKTSCFRSELLPLRQTYYLLNAYYPKGSEARPYNHYFSAHFKDKQTEAQIVELTWPRACT